MRPQTNRRPGNQQQNTQFHHDPAAAAGGGGGGGQQSEDELRRELEYTRDVLRRYREYVQVNYDRKLQEAAEEAELYRQEIQEFQVENAELKKQIAHAQEGVHKANQSQDESYKEVRAELGRVLDQHQEHVNALKGAHQQESDKANQRIKELEAETSRLRTLQDPDALRKEANTEAQRKIGLLERSLESERAQNIANTMKIKQAEGIQKAQQQMERQLKAAISGVHSLALDSQETSSQIGAGLAHAGVDAVGADELAGGWQKALNVIKQTESLLAQKSSSSSEAAAAAAGGGGGGGDAEGTVGVLNQTLLTSLGEVRRAVAHERSGISRGIRQLLGDKEAAEVELQRKEQVFQNELQLFQRRMTELEEDRYAEHHAANTAADRARHMDMLNDPQGAATTNSSSSSPADQRGAPTRSALMAAAASSGLNLSSANNTSSSSAAGRDSSGFHSEISPVSVAPFYGQNAASSSSSSSSSGGAVHKRTIAVQTGVELSSPTSAAGSSQHQQQQDRPSRLVSELEETQEQLTRAREVVRLLDMQRQQFMYFVHDPQLEEDIARALGAGSISTGDFVNLSGKRFIHHTASQF